MNKKAVESFPFGLLLSLIVLVVVFVGGFYLVDVLEGFSSESQFFSDLHALKDKIEFLKSGDAGSFARFDLIVPNNYSLVFEGSSISFVSGEKFNLEVGVSFPERTVMNSGAYDLLLCYVSCESSDLQMIVFE